MKRIYASNIRSYFKDEMDNIIDILNYLYDMREFNNTKSGTFAGSIPITDNITQSYSVNLQYTDNVYELYILLHSDAVNLLFKFAFKNYEDRYAIQSLSYEFAFIDSKTGLTRIINHLDDLYQDMFKICSKAIVSIDADIRTKIRQLGDSGNKFVNYIKTSF